MSTEQIANINISRYLNESTNAYQKGLEQLSSGSKYSSLADNPTVVAESTDLRIQINFNTRIQSNIGVGNDMLTIAGEFQENIITNIDRIKSLVLESSNGTWTGGDEDALYQEIQASLSAINNIASTANFNGINLLDGSAKGVSFKIGSGASDVINIDPVLIDSSTTGLDINTGVTSAADWTPANLADYMARLDAASAKLTNNCSTIGAISTRLDAVTSNLSAQNINLTQYKSNISDADTAELSADLVKNQILQEAATSIFVQNNQLYQMRSELFIGASS